MPEAFDIYTDGACLDNPGGKGGWAYVVLQHGREVSRNSGAVESTTNNRMELLAAINGLLSVPKWSTVVVFSDSQYVVKGANTWAPNWERRGWRRKTKGGESAPVKNLDLWQLLLEVKRERDCRFKWVRGHNGDKWNCECDHLANQACGIEPPGTCEPEYQI